MIDELRKEFERTELFIVYNNQLDIYYTDFGGYKFKKDDKCCFYLNGAWFMFQELRK